MHEKLAIWAGAGILPVQAAIEASTSKSDTVIIAFPGISDIPALRNTGLPVFENGIGQMGKNFRVLKKEKINRLLMVGKFEKSIVLGKTNFDACGLRLLLSLSNRRDMTIFHKLESELKKKGIRVISQLTYLKSWLAGKGHLAGPKPGRSMTREAHEGCKLAKKIADLDIGQTVILRKGTVVAVECVEGTDATIKRGGKLGGGKAGVYKVSRTHQDERFDIPVIGLHTLQVMDRSGLGTLILEANSVILAEKKKFLEFADKKHITVLAVH